METEAAIASTAAARGYLLPADCRAYLVKLREQGEEDEAAPVRRAWGVGSRRIASALRRSRRSGSGPP